jgi:hypothetical protein
MSHPEGMAPVLLCRACGESLGYRTAATDFRHLEEQLTLCRQCFNEAARGIFLVWTDSPYAPCGTRTVPRQRVGRSRTDC